MIYSPQTEVVLDGTLNPELMATALAVGRDKEAKEPLSGRAV
jgi:hypothetical protein